MTDDMSASEMKDLRLRAGLTQSQMAEAMGLGKTAYVDLEAGDDDWKKFKPRHQLALERASLQIALAQGDPSLALPTIQGDIADYVKLDKAPAVAALIPHVQQEIAKIVEYSQKGEDLTSALQTRQATLHTLRQYELDFQPKDHDA